MRDLSAVAEHLRAARAAERNFLRMWAMEQAVILPGLDRVRDDLAGFNGFAGPIHPAVLDADVSRDDEQSDGAAAG